MVMDLTEQELKVLRIVGDMNLAKKSDIERLLLNDGLANKNLDVAAYINTAMEGLMRKSYVTKIHPIGVACYIITRQGSSALMSANRD